MAVDKDIINVLVLFVDEFKVVCALTGGIGTCSTHRCIYCETPLEHMDKSCSALKTVDASSGEFSFGKLPLKPRMLHLREIVF